MISQHARQRHQRRAYGSPAIARRGAAMMLCLFVVFMTTMLLVQILNTLTSDLVVIRSTIDHERALYLANAGVHEAAALLEADNTWRGVASEGTFPNHDTYTATAVDGADPFSVIVVSSGASGEVTRSVTAMLEY
ncbi:hypothetical protein [Adhaeretor mobilis]|uniref:Type 4 fimbrial biogenesis protein PilX N-terminal domain-containing protein n=1 Tax=Adhaeretor mobilis TaxID=1930276 RepID=A0A517MWW0_9BACT|nr:hypothetical protein [Adhaeretor mobilis]QDS99361.1 hypothetical protein HG15A2_26840 [Adhaeretor mobilis]